MYQKTRTTMFPPVESRNTFTKNEMGILKAPFGAFFMPCLP